MSLAPLGGALVGEQLELIRQIGRNIAGEILPAPSSPPASRLADRPVPAAPGAEPDRSNVADHALLEESAGRSGREAGASHSLAGLRSPAGDLSASTSRRQAMSILLASLQGKAMQGFFASTDARPPFSEAGEDPNGEESLRQPAHNGGDPTVPGGQAARASGRSFSGSAVPPALDRAPAESQSAALAAEAAAEADRLDASEFLASLETPAAASSPGDRSSGALLSAGASTSASQRAGPREAMAEAGDEAGKVPLGLAMGESPSAALFGPSRSSARNATAGAGASVSEGAGFPAETGAEGTASDLSASGSAELNSLQAEATVQARRDELLLMEAGRADAFAAGRAGNGDDKAAQASFSTTSLSPAERVDGGLAALDQAVLVEKGVAALGLAGIDAAAYAPLPERAGVIASFILNAHFIPGWPPPRPIEGTAMGKLAEQLRAAELAPKLTQDEVDLLLYLASLGLAPGQLMHLLRLAAGAKARRKLFEALAVLLTNMKSLLAALKEEAAAFVEEFSDEEPIVAQAQAGRRRAHLPLR